MRGLVSVVVAFLGLGVLFLPSPDQLIKDRERALLQSSTPPLVNHVAFSPDGRLLVGLGDGGLSLWRAADGTLERTLDTLGHLDSLDAVTFSPDGGSLITVNLGFLEEWDLRTGAHSPHSSKAGRVDCHAVVSSVTRSAEFSPRGRAVAIATGAGPCIWLERSPESSAQLASSINESAADIAWGPDGHMIAVAWTSGVDIVELQDVGGDVDALLQPGALDQDAAIVRRWNDGTNVGPRAVAFSPDGRTVAAVGTNGLNLWDVASGRVRHPEEAVSGSDVTFSPDGRLIAVAGDGAWVVDAATGRTVRRFSAGRVTSGVDFSPDGKTLATGHEDGARTWDVATGQDLRSYR